MLLDSNIIIYSALAEHAELRRFVTAAAPAVSIISYIEVLGYPRLQTHERAAVDRLFSAAEMMPLTSPIAEQAIRLRQQRKIGLGDSIIAATALVHGWTLATRNTRDFSWIPNLTLLNPVDEV